MGMKPDHLIERAAARLQGTGPLTLPDLAGPGPLPVAPSRMRPDADALIVPKTSAADGPLLGGQMLGGQTIDAAPPQSGKLGSPGSLQSSTRERVSLAVMSRCGMVVATAGRTRISEEYQIAVGRIMRALWTMDESSGPRNILMVTSARPGEGKTFTALNLAASIAQHGPKRALLVDADPKRAPITAALGLSDRPGLMDLTTDTRARVEDVMVATEIEGLSVLPLGSRAREGGAAYSSARPIARTVEMLGRQLPGHLIVLDTPPCLSTSDPNMLAPHVGQVVMVVEAGQTQRNEVQAALELVKTCPNIIVLLNKIRFTSSHTFGAYDYFGSYM